MNHNYLKNIFFITFICKPFLFICQTTNIDPNYIKYSFEKKSDYIDVNYGFVDLIKRDINKLIDEIKNSKNPAIILASSSATYKYTSAGPFYFKYEYGVTDHIGLGFIVGYYTGQLTEKNTHSDGVNTYQDISIYKIDKPSIATNVKFHFIDDKKFDSFLSLALGYSNEKFNYTYNSTQPNYVPIKLFDFAPTPLYLGVTLGIRYFFIENIGINIEAGFENQAIVQTGIIFKI